VKNHASTRKDSELLAFLKDSSNWDDLEKFFEMVWVLALHMKLHLPQELQLLLNVA